MMAKMFYTLDETKAALAKNEEEIKQLAREGRLREFRDGPRLMFKADQVDSLRNELGGGGADVDLGHSDSGSPIGLVDSLSSSGTGISLMDSDSGGSRAGSGAPLKDDTALAADLGLSGSIGGVPSPRPGGSMSGGSGLSGSKGGINVFGDDSMAHADPMAQTAISPGVSDQVDLAGVGSGSGLLDLTRESDDTSLGAELLDEIAPGRGRPGESRAGTGVAAAVGEPARRGVGAVYVEARDPSAAAFGGMALAAALFLLLGVLVLTSGVLGTQPALVAKLGELGFLIVAAIGVALVIIFGIVGLVVGKSST